MEHKHSRAQYLTLGVSSTVHHPRASSSQVSLKGIVLDIGASKVGQWADDVVVAHDVVHGIAVLYPIILIHPVSILQHYCLQANIISMWYAELDTWKRKSLKLLCAFLLY